MAMKQQHTESKRVKVGIDKFVLLLVTIYLLVPLLATLVFAFVNGNVVSLSVVTDVFSDSDFLATLLLSLGLSVASTLLALVLVAPTAYWVQLRLPRARPLLDILSLLPFAVPPIILSLGYLELFGSPPTWINILSLGLVPLLNNPPFVIADTQGLLICAYVIIALPFTYRPIDNNLRAINTTVLSEAASSLGSNWWRTFFVVILPNILPGITSAALLTFTTAMGEFTIASLSGIYTFPVYLNQTGQNDPHKAAWLTIVSFLIILVCTLAIILLVRDKSGKRTTISTTIDVGTGH
jgi:putative spermidine/putrescine transport system permease protein